MPDAVLHVVAGADGHGVTRHALSLLTRPGLAHHRVHRVHVDTSDAAAIAAVLDALPDARLVHLHLTDHLWGTTAGDCAGAITRLARTRRVSLTLHDLPQPADGPGRHERRRRAYAGMAEVSHGVVVASRHEAGLLEEACRAEGRRLPDVAVIPLPITPPPSRAPLPPSGPRRLGVFGFVYPGKGHADALEALDSLPPDVSLVALGEVSAGHDALVADLRRRAGELGRTIDVTGHIPDEAVSDALRDVSVPVAPHRHVSASGSIGSWLSAGRRPLVPDGAYVAELADRCPGAVVRYGPGMPHADLPAAARAALDDPTLTLLDDTASRPGALGPDVDEAARLLADALDGWVCP